jgi:hypothetical protein
VTISRDKQDLALRLLRASAANDPSGYANASAVQRALRELGEPMALGTLTRLATVHDVPLKQGRREGFKLSPNARRSPGRKPLPEGAKATKYSKHRARCWELKAEGKTLQETANIIKDENGLDSFTRQNVWWLLQDPPTEPPSTDCKDKK